MSLNLIQKAIQYTREAKEEFLSANWGITEPLTPRARRNVQYLMLREFINKGCREATRLVLDHYKRPIAYGILVKAVDEIFHYGYNVTLINMWNDLLDQLIGTH